MAKNFHQQIHSDNYHQQREEMFQKHEADKVGGKKKRKLVVYVILVVLVMAIGGYSVSYFSTPGPYDDFAKCLTDRGAVMYGAIKWCQYTQGQAAMFGKSFKYIDYRDESELEGIKTRPTWVINGKWHEKVQSFQTLGAATGCEI